MAKAYRRRPPEDRFFEKVQDGEIPAKRPDLGPCWQWVGSVRTTGYGTFKRESYVTVLAHRFAYEFFIGPIPDGLVLDHLCRNRTCVNPHHLEPVTGVENVMRGEGFAARNAAQTHCHKGHPFAGDNLRVRKDGSRRCVACQRTHDKRRDKRRT